MTSFTNRHGYFHWHTRLIFISRLPIKWAKIPTPKHRESFHFVYPPKTWVTHVFSHPGECKELQPYSSSQKTFFSLGVKFESRYDWNHIQKPGAFFLLQSRMYTPIDELPPCDLRSFLATKRGCSESMHLLCVIGFAFPFSWCDVL